MTFRRKRMPTTKDSQFIQEALKMVQEAEGEGITLRIIGAVAFRIHCPKFRHLLDAMERRITDMDFAGYRKQRVTIINFFQNRGYSIDNAMLLLNERLTFRNGSGAHVDVFLDKLSMCHTIDFKNRLAQDTPTFTLADLLMEKMQIVQINEKDLKDTIVLLREHPVGEGDAETVNSEYITNDLAADWGFHYTFTTNLKKVLEFLPTYPALTDEDRKDIESKITILLDRIEATPKSARWKMRAKVGTKSKWYRDVEESYG